MKIKLYTCVSKTVDYIGLNQYITYWEKEGWIERIQIPMIRDRRFISWVGRVGGLALEPSNTDYIITPYEYALCCQYRSSWKKNERVLPWNFYVRDWNAYSSVQSKLPYKKTTKSIFSGTIRGNRHHRNIWKDSTEIFSFRPAKSYKRTNMLFPTLTNYYEGLAKSRFGLCPVGDCPVCQRETETMGLGCVPIFTPGVEWDYYVPMKENVHFIFAKDPQEMNKKIEDLSLSQYNDLYNNGIQYFEDHCSPEGLWDSVLGTIEKYNINVG